MQVAIQAIDQEHANVVLLDRVANLEGEFTRRLFRWINPMHFDETLADQGFELEAEIVRPRHHSPDRLIEGIAHALLATLCGSHEDLQPNRRFARPRLTDEQRARTSREAAAPEPNE